MLAAGSKGRELSRVSAPGGLASGLSRMELTEGSERWELRSNPDMANCKDDCGEDEPVSDMMDRARRRAERQVSERMRRGRYLQVVSRHLSLGGVPVGEINSLTGQKKSIYIYIYIYI